MTPSAVVLPLASSQASLERVGGKGRSLATMAIAGLPVPDGFLVATEAYRQFVNTHSLEPSIRHAIAHAGSDVDGLEAASARIRALFESAPVPGTIEAEIRAAYDTLGAEIPAVAVRSSATAEDLPDLSFAGQQDTYLNVRGPTELLDAVRRCWASLWTARAMGYRMRMGIDQAAIAMGVVVQRMVNAQVSGILFTANPATGSRSEFVVNASYGLGEAIVGGEVTPDTFVLDRGTLAAKETHIGAKKAMIVSTRGQGTATRPVPEAQRKEASLSAETLDRLGALALEAERLFDAQPQDIEWAVADAACWLLQSRAITNLPAAPLEDVSWDPPGEGVKLVRRQVVENMPDALSPLFDELYLSEGLDQSIDAMFAELGIPIEIGAVVERPMFLTVNGFAYCRANYDLGWPLLRVLPKALWWYVSKMPRLLKTLIPRWQEHGLPAYLQTIEHWKATDLAAAPDEQLLTGVRELANADARYWWNTALVVAAAKITDAALNLFLTSRLVPGNLTSGVFLRGFPSKTRDAQVGLERIAQRIGEDEDLRRRVIASPPERLFELLAHTPVASDLDRYFEVYGHQIFTLDFVQPTQAEDPHGAVLTLKTLVEQGDGDSAARQVAMAEERDSLKSETLERLGPVRRWLFSKFLGLAQRFGPYREEALFYLGAAWPTLRRLAGELGQRLVSAGTLADPDHVFYLQSAELARASAARSDGRSLPELGDLAVERRALREARMRLHPPGFLPESERFRVFFIDLSAFETQKRNAADADTLNGFAVSPGKVTGPASVILTPADFADMRPDTILVCPTTTPAWTPLFTQATGLVTDIGGILAHGSIVAREYGIPAVLGTGNGTQRIDSGQHITVDGDAGTVTLVDSLDG